MKIKLYQMKYIAGLCGNLIFIFFIIQVQSTGICDKKILIERYKIKAICFRRLCKAILVIKVKEI